MRKQLFPFEKNRYFKKKRMRAVDFERDQAFADQKIAFLSHWLLGTGVAFGLGVQRIDSDSLLVEPGMAIDSQGRFLIVDEPAIYRIRALEGFQELTGETATLWLSYREELLDPMFIADDEGQSTQYAAAKERFALSLADEEPLPQPAAERVLLSEYVLYEDEELRIIQSLPRVLSASRPFQIHLYLQCSSPEPLELELRYAPELPGFADERGEPPVLHRHLRAEKGETLLTLRVRPMQPAQTVRFSVTNQGFSLEKRGVRCGVQAEFSDEFPVESGDVVSALAARLYARSIQELWDDMPLGVPIANVRFVRCGEQALLDDVFPLGSRRRAAAPNLQAHLRHTANRFDRAGERAGEAPAAAAALHRGGGEGAPPAHGVQVVTGSVVLNAGLHRKAGSILTSDEIAHGLGPGAVYVEFGIEHIYPVANFDQNRTDLLLGDVSLFDQASGSYDRDFDRGVRVHPDKGTFELAVRLRADLRQSSLRFRWFAWRTQDAASEAEPDGALIRLAPDVIHVKPGAAVSFTAIFSQGRSAPCDFFVVEKQGGVITRDGVYTAPDRTGLYQIYAQVRGRPEEQANAFIIVEAGDAEDGLAGV